MVDYGFLDFIQEARKRYGKTCGLVPMLNKKDFTLAQLNTVVSRVSKHVDEFLKQYESQRNDVESVSRLVRSLCRVNGLDKSGYPTVRMGLLKFLETQTSTSIENLKITLMQMLLDAMDYRLTSIIMSSVCPCTSNGEKEHVERCNGCQA